MKRFAVLFAAVALLLNTCAIGVYADASGTAVQKKVMLYLKPDLTVELNGARQIFKNVKGETVYPIIYNGTTYLPVRAVSALMKEPIEWDSGSKTVFIGKTLSNPNKSSAPIPTGAAISASEKDTEKITAAPSLVTGYSKPDVLVMYDFVIQSFQDVNGAIVYPVIYNGTTYLPVRAVSNLMNEPIIWDAAAKKICIGDGKEDTEQPKEQEPAEKISAAAAKLKDLYDREETLYYEATAKITNLKTAETTEDKQVIAASASENYVRAQANTVEIKSTDLSSFTDEEKAAHEKLLAFAESTEYYVLVLENIAYLAASDADYSMLAETFLYFAMESQTKMNEARAVIIQ